MVLASVIGVDFSSSVVIDADVVCRPSSAAVLLCGTVLRTAARRTAGRRKDGRRREGGHGERYRTDAARVDDRRHAGPRGGSGGTDRRRKDAAERRREGRSGRGTSPGDHGLVEFLQQAVHLRDPLYLRRQ